MSELRAGRELDAMIAERVMGAKWEAIGDNGRTLLCIGSEASGDRRNLAWRKPDQCLMTLFSLPPYSTSIAAAWEVVEKMTKDGRAVFIDSAGFDPEMWRVCVSADDPEGQLPSEAATAPLAICLAALEAVEHSPESPSSLLVAEK